MKIAVISDLHLGTGDRADWFEHSDEDFLPFLRFLEQNFERIVLLGDVYETLRAGTPSASRSKLRACREAHKPLAERFDTDQYLYVHGNHDLIALHTENAPTSLSMDLGDVRVLFTHGHQNDFIIRHLRWLSESGAWLAGLASRVGLLPLIRKIEELEGYLRGTDDDPEECKFQQWARSMASKHDYDVIVTGHTHEPLRTTHRDVLYLNSGACCEGQFNWISMDTNAVSFEVHETY